VIDFFEKKINHLDLNRFGSPFFKMIGDFKKEVVAALRKMI